MSALKLADKSIKLNGGPENVEAFLLRGKILMELGKTVLAIKDMSKVRRMNPALIPRGFDDAAMNKSFQNMKNPDRVLDLCSQGRLIPHIIIRREGDGSWMDEFGEEQVVRYMNDIIALLLDYDKVLSNPEFPNSTSPSSLLKEKSIPEDKIRKICVRFWKKLSLQFERFNHVKPQYFLKRRDGATVSDLVKETTDFFLKALKETFFENVEERLEKFLPILKSSFMKHERGAWGVEKHNPKAGKFFSFLLLDTFHTDDPRRMYWGTFTVGKDLKPVVTGTGFIVQSQDNPQQFEPCYYGRMKQGKKDGKGVEFERVLISEPRSGGDQCEINPHGFSFEGEFKEDERTGKGFNYVTAKDGFIGCRKSEVDYDELNGEKFVVHFGSKWLWFYKGTNDRKLCPFNVVKFDKNIRNSLGDPTHVLEGKTNEPKNRVKGGVSKYSVMYKIPTNLIPLSGRTYDGNNTPNEEHAFLKIFKVRGGESSKEVDECFRSARKFMDLMRRTTSPYLPKPFAIVAERRVIAVFLPPYEMPIQKYLDENTETIDSGPREMELCAKLERFRRNFQRSGRFDQERIRKKAENTSRETSFNNVDIDVKFSGTEYTFAWKKLGLEIYSNDILREWIQKAKVMYNREVKFEVLCKFAKQIAIALNDLHSSGLCHRDLRIENIFINENEEVRVWGARIEDTPGFTYRSFNIMAPDNSYSSKGDNVLDPFFLRNGKLKSGYTMEMDIFRFGVVVMKLLYRTKVVSPFFKDLPCSLNTCGCGELVAFIDDNLLLKKHSEECQFNPGKKSALWRDPRVPKCFAMTLQQCVHPNHLRRPVSQVLVGIFKNHEERGIFPIVIHLFFPDIEVEKHVLLLDTLNDERMELLHSLIVKYVRSKKSEDFVKDFVFELVVGNCRNLDVENVKALFHERKFKAERIVGNSIEEEVEEGPVREVNAWKGIGFLKLKVKRIKPEDVTESPDRSPFTSHMRSIRNTSKNSGLEDLYKLRDQIDSIIEEKKRTKKKLKE